ncbi:MAG: hypothetical protein NTW85_12515 [Methylococcales bacterium]|nr:hypothetical protein [Methylococcales bacterium]
MSLKYQSNRFSVVVMIITAMATTNVQATTPTSDFQTWIPVNINVKLTDKLRGFLEFQQRIGNDNTHGENKQ